MPTYSFFGYDPAALPYDANTGTFTFRAAYDHTQDRVRFDITDDDRYLDGDRCADERGEDANQTGIVSRPDGTVLDAGRIYVEQYGVLEAPNGGRVMIDRIEIGGKLVGYVPSRPLEPGLTYRYVGGGDVDDFRDISWMPDNRMTYAQYQSASVPCFGIGTPILTPSGEVPVERLAAGDLVETLDHGPQPVLWLGLCRVSRAEIAARPDLAPVVLRRGAVDGDAPDRPLRLSGNHRVLLRGPHLSLLFGVEEALAPAKALGGPAPPAAAGTAYAHILLERHEIVCAAGLWVESLLLACGTLASLPRAMRRQVTATLAGGAMRAARPFLCPSEVAIWRDRSENRMFRVA